MSIAGLGPNPKNKSSAGLRAGMTVFAVSVKRRFPIKKELRIDVRAFSEFTDPGWHARAGIPYWRPSAAIYFRHFLFRTDSSATETAEKMAGDAVQGDLLLYFDEYVALVLVMPAFLLTQCSSFSW